MKNATSFRKDYDFGASSRRGHACRDCAHLRRGKCRHPDLHSPFDVPEWVSAYRGCRKGFKPKEARDGKA